MFPCQDSGIPSQVEIRFEPHLYFVFVFLFVSLFLLVSPFFFLIFHLFSVFFAFFFSEFCNIFVFFLLCFFLTVVISERTCSYFDLWIPSLVQTETKSIRWASKYSLGGKVREPCGVDVPADPLAWVELVWAGYNNLGRPDAVRQRLLDGLEQIAGVFTNKTVSDCAQTTKWCLQSGSGTLGNQSYFLWNPPC